MYFYFVSLRATIRIQVQYLTRIRISPYKDADSDRTGSAKLVKAFLYLFCCINAFILLLNLIL